MRCIQLNHLEYTVLFTTDLIYADIWKREICFTSRYCHNFLHKQMMFAEGLFILFQKTENIRLRGAPYFHLNFLLYVHRIVQGQPFNKLDYTYIYI